MAEDKKNSDTMRELRDWLVTKCRLPGFVTSNESSASSSRQFGGFRDKHYGQQQQQHQQQFTAHVVTPRTIPQFVIPGSNDSSRRPSIGSNDDVLSHSSGDPSVASWSASTSPGVSPRSSFSALTAPEHINARARSAPVSPRRDSHGFLKDFSVRSMTNLPHLQVDQGSHNNGPMLNTQRKFSNSSLTTGSTLLCRDPRISARKGSLTIPGSEMRQRSRRMHRSSQDFGPRYERSVSSDLLHVGPHSSEYRGMYTGLTDKNEYLPLKESFRRSKRYYRRRSSLATADVVRLLYQQNSSDGSSFSNRSPSHSSRYRKQLSPGDPLQDKRHSSPEVRVTDTHCMTKAMHGSLDKSKSNSLTSIVKCTVTRASPEPDAVVDVKPETERGEIKFSFQYFPATKRLKVILIKLEGLRFPDKPDFTLNPFVKLCLMPGKLQKQSSEPLRHTCAPVFNKEFFFIDLSLEDMKNLRLRLKTFHKPHHLKLPEYLGEVNVPLSNYDLLMENRMWNDLHFKPYKKDLGHLQVELLLESRQAHLLVVVTQARGLPSQHLTGAPDPYVRITVWQFGQIVNQYQTSVKKNTTTPIFNETFDFQINIRSKALSHTKIVFGVYDKDRLRSDPLIGRVTMGQGATEDSVMEHWEEAMVGNGRRVCRWHYIMEKGETND